MNDITEIVRDATADRDWRGADWDAAFCRPELSDDALTAAVWASARFYPTFPGWQLYRRINAGMTLHDDELDAWIIGGARLLARARKRNGRRYIEARGLWIDQAARDALETMITGRQPASARERALMLEISRDMYLKIYKPLLACLVLGFDSFRSELHAGYRKVKIATDDFGCNVTSGKEPLDYSRLWYGPRVGNACAPRRASGSD